MMERKTTYRVFISSTYLDNAERRKVVEDAVLRADMQPVGMERFTASARPTVQECERLARECDVYVGIIAHRYGWIPDGHSGGDRTRISSSSSDGIAVCILI